MELVQSCKQIFEEVDLLFKASQDLSEHFQTALKSLKSTEDVSAVNFKAIQTWSQAVDNAEKTIKINHIQPEEFYHICMKNHHNFVV